MAGFFMVSDHFVRQPSLQVPFGNPITLNNGYYSVENSTDGAHESDYRPPIINEVIVNAADNFAIQFTRTRVGHIGTNYAYPLP